VEIVADCGVFSQVRETLPPGFTYVSVSDPDNLLVEQENGEVRFTLMGAISFSYTVQAPMVEDTYLFEGVVLDWDKNPFAVAGDTSITVGKVLDSIGVEPGEVSLPIAATQQLAVTATYDDASTAVVTDEADYESDDPTVATVSATGLVTAESEGSAIITVTYTEGAVTRTATVLVEVYRVLDSIAAAPDEVSLPFGDTQQLAITATYEDSSTADVTAAADYESDDPTVATVSGTGLITAVGEGSATITVTYTEGPETETATVSVDVYKVLESIQADPDDVSLPVAGTQQIDVTANYNDGSTADVTDEADYESSDASVATVSATGLITAAGEGSAIITVTYTEDAVVRTATVAVDVYKVLDSIAAHPDDVSLPVADSQQLAITATYEDASTADVTAAASYESDDPTVATVSGTGLITAVGEGSATITVTYTEGPETKTATVPVDVTWSPWVYDEDGDGVIDKMEAIKAIQDYYNDMITKAQVLEVIAAYYAA